MNVWISHPWPGRLLITSLAALLALVLGTATPGRSVVDEMLRDPLVRLAAEPTEETRLTVVDIDETSLAELGPWPWPRARLADLAENILGPLGARAVALDMVLPEARDASGDVRLAALAAHAPLTLAVALDYQPRYPPLAQGTTGMVKRWQDAAAAVPATGYVGNHALLGSARCVGNIGFVPDADGALRRLPLFSRLGEQTIPALSIALLDCAGDAQPDLARAHTVDGLWRIPFQRHWSAYSVVPASLVLAQNAPRELFAGRYVLVGSSALGLSDRVTTPLSASTSGVLVHAAVLSALLDTFPPTPQGTGVPQADRGLATVRASAALFSGRAQQAGLTAAPAFAWLTATLALWLAMLHRVSPLSGVALLVALSLGWVGLVWHMDIALPLVPVLSSYAVLLLAGIPYEWWLVRRESARVLKMFSQYVAPSVLAELLRHRGEHPLEPRFCVVTALNADMEGYTRATTALALDEVASLTKEFLDCLTRPILAEEGTLDKYTGDGLVAFWNAPLPCNDHGERAVRAACAIHAAVQAWNERRAANGKEPVRVRIGIESGPALVGDLGTSFRSTYTAVGNCINFAAKLQEGARDLAANIVVGPGASQHVRASLLQPLGCLQPRGLSHAVELFTVATPSSPV